MRLFESVGVLIGSWVGVLSVTSCTLTTDADADAITAAAAAAAKAVTRNLFRGGGGGECFLPSLSFLSVYPSFLRLEVAPQIQLRDLVERF